MKKYLTTLALVIVILLISIAGFNWLIDPFDLLNSPQINGLNVYKPKIRDRVTKVYKTNRIKPLTIILGSSRSINIPSEHKLFVNKPVYNLALKSGSGYEMFRIFQHAHAVKPLKTVIIGLDEGFGNSTYTNFNEDRLAVDKHGAVNLKRYFQYTRDVYNSLLSIDAIRASVSTIKQQKKYAVTNFHQLDMETRVSYAGGHHQMFASLENAYMENLDQINNCSVDSSIPSLDSTRASISRLDYFKTMLETAYQDNIQMKIFFSPVHARLQEIYCIKDASLSFEGFKFSVVTLVELIAKKYHKKPFLIVDFSGYNRITTEALPAHGDKNTLMKWYWEGSHYTTATAKVILDKILATEPISDSDNFGVVLHRNNIIQHLKTQRKRRVLYQRTHKSDIDEIHNRAQLKINNVFTK